MSESSNFWGNIEKEWKTILRHGLLLLGFCLLLYYYKEIYYCCHQGWRFFRNKQRVNQFIVSFGAYAPLVFIGLQFLQVLLAPIPGEFTGFIGGYLFGIVPGLIFSTIGLSLGSIFAFWIARRLGLPFVSRFVGRETMAKFDYLMEHKGAFFSFILFLIPGFPKDYFCYLLGLSPMHVITFLVISIVGRFPGTVLLTMQGYSIRSENYRAFFVILGLVLLAIVFTVVYRDRLEKLFKQRRRVSG